MENQIKIFEYISDSELSLRASSCFNEGQFFQSAIFFDALLLRQNGNNVGDVGTHNMAGLAFRHAGILEKAKTEYQKAIDLGADISNLNNLAIVFMELADFENSEKLYQQIFEKIGYDDPFYLTNYATMLTFKGEYIKALKFFQKAQYYYETRLNDPQNYAHSKFRSALALSRMGFFEDSLNDFNIALKSKKDFYSRISTGLDHPRIAEIRLYMAECLYDQGEYESARLEAEDALRVFQNTISRKAPNVGRCMLLIGGAACAKGDYTYALHMLKFAKQIFIEAYQNYPNHIDLARCESLIGETLGRSGNFQKAIRQISNSISIFETYPNMTSPYSAEAWNNLGYCLRRMHQYCKAWTCFKKSHDIFKKIRFDHPWLKDLYYNMQQCLIGAGHIRFSQVLHYKMHDLQKTQKINLPQKVRIILMATDDTAELSDLVTMQFKQIVSYYKNSTLCTVEFINCSELDMKQVLDLCDTKDCYKTLYICLQGSELKKEELKHATAQAHPWIVDYRGRSCTEIINIFNFNISDSCYVYSKDVQQLTMMYKQEVQRCGKSICFKQIYGDCRLSSNELAKTINNRLVYYINELENAVKKERENDGSECT